MKLTAAAALLAFAPSALAATPTEVWYPTVVNAEGLNGARYYSVLTVKNPSDSPVNLSVDGFVSNRDGLSAPTATVTATIPPRTHATIPNVLASLFGGLTGLAAARITADGPALFFHSVVNDHGGEGKGNTFLKVDNARVANVVSSGTLLQLANASVADRASGVGSRTNIGYFNPGFEAKSVLFRAFTPDGRLIGETRRTIPAWSQVQEPVFSLIAPAASGDTAHEDFYVTFEVEGGGLLVYSTVVDNRTNDGVYQMAE